MSKIKKARAWLAKKERIPSASEKRGDETLNWIIKVGVGLLLLGAVAAVLWFFVRDTGDDISEQAASISGAAAGYNPTCDINRATPAGVITRVYPNANERQNIQIPFVVNGNYRIPTAADFVVDASGLTTNTAGVLGLNAGTAIPNNEGVVGFVITSEERFNADFNGNGAIDVGTVVGILQSGDQVDISPTAADAATGNGTHVATGAGAPPILLADSQTDITDQPTINGLAVGQRLMVNRLDSCWRVA